MVKPLPNHLKILFSCVIKPFGLYLDTPQTENRKVCASKKSSLALFSYLLYMSYTVAAYNAYNNACNNAAYHKHRNKI